MITSVVLGTFGLLTGLIGIQCSKAGGDNLALKGRIAGTGGVFFLLQGNAEHSVRKRKKKSCTTWLELIPPPRLFSKWLKKVWLVFGPNAGLCTMVAVSWYAFNITQDFFDPFYPGIRWGGGTRAWNNKRSVNERRASDLTPHIILQVWNRRRALHWLVLSRAGPRRGSVSHLFLQSWRRGRKIVSWILSLYCLCYHTTALTALLLMFYLII